MLSGKLATRVLVAIAIVSGLSLAASQRPVPVAPPNMDLESVVMRFSAAGYCRSDAHRFAHCGLGIIPEELREPLPPGAQAAPPPPAALADIRARFIASGQTEADAEHFALLALDIAPQADSGCAFYHVQEFNCDSRTLRWRDFYVGTICIRKALPHCLEPSSTAGEKVFFKLKTSGDSDMPSTCVLLAVEGPLGTSKTYIRDRLVDCSRWPQLSCFTAVRLPVETEWNHPVDCPECK